MGEYGLGRIKSVVTRQSEFPAELALKDLPDSLPTRKYWHIGEKLITDQGNTSQCVGRSLDHDLKASPVKVLNGPVPLAIYDGAQLYDNIPGTNYDGTTVDGGARFLHKEGWFENYVWAYDIEVMKTFVLTKGTIVVGTDWYENMFYPNNRNGGMLEITGNLAGGHAYLCLGYSSTMKAFRFLNSWGRDWGQNGRFWIKESDFQVLLDRNGEACCPLDFKVNPV